MASRRKIEITPQQGTHPFEEEFFENYSADFEDFDDLEGQDPEDVSLSEIDFSEIRGDNFADELKKLDHKIGVQRNIKMRAYNKKGNRLRKKMKKRNKTHKIIVPSEREVIIQGVSNFILSQNANDTEAKSLPYYKGKKLNNLTLIFNNTNAVDFNLQLFDPSMMMDYLYENSLNLNDMIQVAGGTTQYSDVLFYLLSNPTLITAAQVNVAAPTPELRQAQFNQPFFFKNKNIAGMQAIEPMQIQLSLDNMQFQNNTVSFSIIKKLNRPFVPDGMDVIVYKVLAGNTVTMNFFYKQVQLKRMVFEECRRTKTLL